MSPGKASILLLLVVATAVPAAASDQDGWLNVVTRDYPNLLYNPGAETPGWFREGQPALWQDRPNFSRDTDVAHTGAASFRIAGPGQGYTFQTGGVALKPNTEYVASAWVKTERVRGPGVTLEYTAAAKIDRQFARGTSDWTRIETRFTTAAPSPRAHLRIRYELDEGDVAWVDDLKLVPADGRIDPAPAPTITPAGGRHRGAVTVTMETRLPGSEIRYTADGSEPHGLSTLYRGPFLLMDRVTLRAKTFHNGYRDSDPTVARFDLQPVADAGVPLYPIDWSQTVDEWWKTHWLNPDSPGAVTKINSPRPVLNVADVRDASPATATAGIAEALAQLPEQGGTLWFPKDRGPYEITKPEEALNSYYYSQGAVLIHRRSNVHFVSDGAEIRCASAVFGISSVEYHDAKMFNLPVRNFYFRDLVFDGLGKADIAVNFIHASDVLMDGCTFRNFAPVRETAGPRSWKGHPAPVVATAMSDNLWLRGCTFSGSRWGVYWDGVHNGGILGCDFPGPYAAGCVLIMTNNDMAPFSPTQRNAQYVVIDGNHFHGGRSGVNLSSSNCLVADNRAEGLPKFFTQHGRPRSNTRRGVIYEIYGNRVLGNTLTDVPVFTSWAMPCRSFGERPANLIAANRATGLDVILTHDAPGRRDPLENIVIRDNRLSGQDRPQVRLDPAAGELIRDVVVASNELSGTPRPIIANLAGEPAAFSGVGYTEGEQ